MIFTKATEEQTEQIVRFYLDIVSRLKATVNYPKWHDGHPCAADVENAVKNGTQYICTDDGALIGAVILSEDPEGYYEAGNWTPELSRGEYLIIHALAVHSEKARKGIGSFLVKECIRTARNGSYRSIRLDTVPDNHPANRLYLKNGFRYIGTVDLRRDIPDIPEFSLFELDL